ncbi:arsenate reductase [Rubricella aquisinus]|uniref:Arsenate reductase n=1 Tax=Rubricella aquisinus TaxID=2028108 RepID=A0A840WGD1_9RHOB|nr:arsenate reductase ArsC [Rubricella aquisinus]MBB5514208.1 arsenate reductase [Rubricella aquisinus]
MLRILFLCTGNSARSILAEATLNGRGGAAFRGYSAGSMPTGAVQPFALEVIKAQGYPATGYRSKSWDEFSGPDAVRMDGIITVCDNAAGEACPLWLGNPSTAHWGLPDPAAVTGQRDVQRAAYASTHQALAARIDALIAAKPTAATLAPTLKRIAAEFA